MKYLKTLFIATILLSLNLTFGAEYSAYTQKQPIDLEEQVDAAESTPVTASPATQEATKEKSAVEKWNNHLVNLEAKDQHWNVNSNIPTDPWREEAFTFAKKALDEDKTIAQAIKSAFFNAITAKIKQENGEFTASTYALIKEFNDTVDAYVTTITEPKPIEEEPVVEEAQPEPVVEQPAPTEVETVPTPPAEEETVSQTDTAVTTTETPRDVMQEWNDLLDDIKTEGTTLKETQDLLRKAYQLANELLSQELIYPEKLQFDLQNALSERRWYPNLFVINSSNAMEAFSQATGIPLITQNNRGQQAQQQAREKELKLQAEQQAALEKQKEAAIRLTMLERIGETPKGSGIQDLTLRLKQKMAAMQTETDAKIKKMQQELVALRRVKEEKAPQAQGGIIGAIKNIASAASKWWYGQSEESTATAALDQERFKKLQEILDAMASQPNPKITVIEKLAIENSWNTFISGLRTFKNIDINNTQAVQDWLNPIKKALRELIITYHLISTDDASEIIKDALKESTQGNKIIREITKYVKDEKDKIIHAKQQKQATKLNKIQQKQEKKELAMLEQQRIKDEKKRIKAERQKQLSIAEAFRNEKDQWNQFLAQLSQRIYTTQKENDDDTEKAIDRAKSLFNLAGLIPSENKDQLAQEFKHQFPNALLKSERPVHVNIHKNMDQFNAAINRIMD